MAEPTSASSKAEGAALLARPSLAEWLCAWVSEHSDTDLKDEGGRLRLVCRCGTYLGISYGPTDNPKDALEREALAYFEHQAEALIEAGYAAPEHGPDVCGKVPCAVCWAPGGLGLNEKGECRLDCAYGTCGGQGYTACGGCCGCRGGCVVQWENQQPRTQAGGPK